MRILINACILRAALGGRSLSGALCPTDKGYNVCLLRDDVFWRVLSSFRMARRREAMVIQSELRY